jgi:hypothetical protein
MANRRERASESIRLGRSWGDEIALVETDTDMNGPTNLAVAAVLRWLR